MELHNARSAGGMAAAAISWRDVLAWQEVRRVQLTPWEVDTLMAMDVEAMKFLNETKNHEHRNP